MALNYMKNGDYKTFFNKVVAIGKDCFEQSSIAEQDTENKYLKYQMHYDNKTLYVNREKAKSHVDDIANLFDYISLGDYR